MKLQEMYPNFLGMSESEQLNHIISLRKQREVDFAELDEDGKVRRSKTSRIKDDEGVFFSKEDMSVLKMLGITAKDIKKLQKTQLKEANSGSGDKDFFD